MIQADEKEKLKIPAISIPLILVTKIINIKERKETQAVPNVFQI